MEHQDLSGQAPMYMYEKLLKNSHEVTRPYLGGRHSRRGRNRVYRLIWVDAVKMQKPCQQIRDPALQILPRSLHGSIESPEHNGQGLFAD